VDRLLIFSSKILMELAASSALRCSSVAAFGQIALGEGRRAAMVSVPQSRSPAYSPQTEMMAPCGSLTEGPEGEL